MRVEAYAKVNLIMNVLGKRPDGYHQVETLMQAIDLCDTVDVELSEGSGIELSCSDKSLEGNDNLAVKAARIMAEKYEIRKKISIKIEKRIPVAAGLGGGSADGAAVITALGKLCGEESLEKLLEIGALLGSDVPFCVAAQNGHKAAIGRGTGTELEFVKESPLKIELTSIKAEIPNKTKAVYAELKPEDCTPVYDIRAFLAADSTQEKEKLMGNHLQAPAFRILKSMGVSLPEGNFHLSGAGPTIFTIK